MTDIQVFRPRLFFCLALCFFQYALIFGQTSVAKDSSKTTTFQFISKKIENQARESGFNYQSPFKKFTVSANGVDYKALFPPTKITSSDFQIATWASTDSFLVHTLPLNSLDSICVYRQRKFQFGLANKISSLALVPAAIAAAAWGRENEDALLIIGLSFLYFLPPLTLNGIFSGNEPAKVKYDRQDFFANFGQWKSELGFLYGSIQINDEYNQGGNQKLKGFRFDIRNTNSRFGYSFKLLQFPLPPVTIYDYPEGKKAITDDSELLINPSLRIYNSISRYVKMNILAGYVSQIVSVSKKSEYPYPYSPLWGSLELELQLKPIPYLAIFGNFAYHYSFEGARTPWYWGIAVSN